MVRAFPSVEVGLGLGTTEKEVSIHEKYDRDVDDSANQMSQIQQRSKNQMERAIMSPSGNGIVGDDVADAIYKEMIARPDKVVELTYHKGNLVDPEPKAPLVNVAIHYVPGANAAQVNMMENDELNQEKPVSKSEHWKAFTGGSLLSELDVQSDLSFKTVDQTKEVLARYKERQPRDMAEAVKNLLASSGGDTVNISSNNVTLLNAFSPRGEYDMIATCIEVDGTSLLNLINNFKSIIDEYGQHANMLTDQNVKVLETMIEDARRLLVRSPVLTRAAQRIVIQKSVNTRYGFDTGKQFRTFTTSKGVAEIIRSGAGYYSAIPETSEVYKRIRPRFLQMIVFLLSLLNDKDLERIKPSLEKSYDLKADRQSIELTILKVLTCYAVGPFKFLTGIVSAFRGKRVDIEDLIEKKKKEWDQFLLDIGKLGWLLPAPYTQLGEGTGTWRLQWQKNFVSSDIFDQLQFSGEKNVVNSIPPMKINSEATSAQEVSAELSNGQVFKLLMKDLDQIIMAIKNRYLMTDPENGNQSDLIIREEVIFSELGLVWERLQRICNEVNYYQLPHGTLVPAQERTNGKGNRMSQKISQVLNPRSAGVSKARQIFSVQNQEGTRTKYVTLIRTRKTKIEDKDIIAISWKVNGRRITHNELLRGVSAEIVAFSSCLEDLRAFEKGYTSQQEKSLSSPRNSTQQAQQPPHQHLTRMLAKLSTELDEIQAALTKADSLRQEMQSECDKSAKPDEPIVRVHFPNQLHWKQDMPFCEYEQWWEPSSTPTGSQSGEFTPYCSILTKIRLTPPTLETGKFMVRSEVYKITDDAVCNAGVTTLRLEGGTTITITSLAEAGMDVVETEDIANEFKQNDKILLLGHVAALVLPGQGGFEVGNFYKVTTITRPTTGGAQQRFRRGKGVTKAESALL